MVATLSRGGSVVEDPLVHHPVQEEYHRGPGDALVRAQPLVHGLPGLPRAHSSLAQGPDVPQADLLVLLEGLPQFLFRRIKLERCHQGDVLRLFEFNNVCLI